MKDRIEELLKSFLPEGYTTECISWEGAYGDEISITHPSGHLSLKIESYGGAESSSGMVLTFSFGDITESFDLYEVFGTKTTHDEE